MRYNIHIQTKARKSIRRLNMLTFESAQQAIANFKQVIASKGVYSSHIPALVAKLEKLIPACSCFVFNPEIISERNDYRIVFNTQELLKYADEKLYSSVGLEWLNRNLFDMTIEGKSTGNLYLHIQPRYLFNSRVYVKAIDLPFKRLLEIYALSGRNEKVSYQESMVNKITAWEQHNPYIDDDLAQLQEIISQGVIHAGNNRHIPVGEEVKNVPNDAKHLVFILVEAIFHSIESIKIDNNSTGLEHIVTKPLYGKTITNSESVKTKLKSEDSPVVLSILNISDAKFNVILNSSFSSPYYNGVGVDDWIYVRAHGTKRVYSPSLGVNRRIRIDEYYNLSSFDE